MLEEFFIFSNFFWVTDQWNQNIFHLFYLSSFVIILRIYCYFKLFLVLIRRVKITPKGYECSISYILIQSRLFTLSLARAVYK